MTPPIRTSSRPMDYTRGLQPMAAQDERFWQLRRGEVKPGLLQRIFGRLSA